jgi:hypothetical protein
LRCEFLQFRFGGQRAEPEQVSRLFKGRVDGEFVDVDAAIGENSGLAVDPANTRVGGDNAFESLSSYCSRHMFSMLPVLECCRVQRRNETVNQDDPQHPEDAFQKLQSEMESKILYSAAIPSLSLRRSSGWDTRLRLGLLGKRNS